MCDKKVFVVAAKRSAIGSMLGSLANTHPADLGGAVVRALLESAKVAPEAVDEVIVGIHRRWMRHVTVQTLQ